MIVKKYYKRREDGVNLYETYSDLGYYIQKVGTNEEYDKAIDIETANYSYIETNKKIKEEESLEV